MKFSDLNENSYEKVDESKISYLIGLLYTSGLSNEIKELLECELETFDITPERYDELSRVVFDSQLDRINSGFMYNQTDISKKLKKEIL
jgi:hypothetical protein